MVESEHQAFLKKIGELDSFFEKRRVDTFEIGTDDPDVRRLIEVVSFSSVRSRAPRRPC